MKKYLLLFTALLGLGLNTQATETVTKESTTDLAVSVKNSQWDASAILINEDKLPTSGTITVTAEPNSEVTFTDTEYSDEGAKSTEVTADGTTGIATLDLATVTGADAALSEAQALYVIGENITSVVYQSIPGAPVEVEVTEGSQYVYFMDIEDCWNENALVSDVTFEIVLDCSAANSGGQVGVNYNSWGSWTNAQFSALDQNVTDEDDIYTYTFTGETIADAISSTVGENSIDKIYFEAYNGAIVKSATYKTSGSENATTLTAVKACEVRCTDVLNYPDETITISYTGSEEIWPDIQLVNTQAGETWTKCSGTWPSVSKDNDIELTINEMLTGGWSGATGTLTMFYFYVEIPVEETISMTYGTNITLDAEAEGVVTPLDGTATFDNDALEAFNSEGTTDFTNGPDANGIATTGTVETTFTLTLTALNTTDIPTIYGNSVEKENAVPVAESANETDGTYSLTATDIAVLLQPASPASVLDGNGDEFVLSSLTITGISSCSYTVTTKTTTTAGTYDPDVTYALDMDKLYTYMDETVGRVDKTNDVESGKEFTWDTDKVDAFKLNATDLAAVGADWLTIEDGADLRFRQNSGKNLVQLNGAVSFTMAKAGTVTVELASTGSSNYSSFALSTTASGETTYIEVSEISGEYTEGGETKNTYVEGGVDVTVDSKSLALGQYATYTSANHTTAVWEVEAGEYTFETALANTWSRAARIYALEVVETGAGWAEASVTDLELTEDEIAQLATDGTNTTVTAQQEGELQDTEGNNVYKIDTEYTATLIVSIPAGSEGVTFSFTASETVSGTTGNVEGTEIAGADILAAIKAVEGASSITYGDLTSLTLNGAYAYSIVTEEKVTYTYYTTTETVDGYLTVTLAGETVGDANQKATVTVTTNEVTGEVTMEIASITVTENISLSDVAITFTPGENGAFENGAVTIEGSSIGTATGSYVVDENDDITFSADFTYTLIVSFNIGVSFTTIEPTTEGTEEGTTGDAEIIWNETASYTNVGYQSIAWADLIGYDAVMFELTYTTLDGTEYETWSGWVVGGVYTFADGVNAAYAFTATNDEGDTYILTVEELLEYCDPDESGFAYNGWSPVASINVYFGVYEGSEGWNSIAEVKSDIEVVEVARYNLMGQKISTAEKGINIIVYSDGSAKKVLVK